MNTRYDVAIIGCGEAGIFAGYELKKLRPELNVLVMDQGADIYTRQCPIVSGKVETGIQAPADFVNIPHHELPSTGGRGTYLYTIGGLSLMAMACLLYYRKRERHHRKGVSE